MTSVAGRKRRKTHRDASPRGVRIGWDWSGRLCGTRGPIVGRRLASVEGAFYRLIGTKREEQAWKSYAKTVLVFTILFSALLYAIQRLQDVLPLNPAGQSAVSPDLAFNTSVSFMTNTNWQSYVPETTMSYLTQMSALTVHNFVSAATGIWLDVIAAVERKQANV